MRQEGRRQRVHPGIWHHGGLCRQRRRCHARAARDNLQGGPQHLA